MLAWFVSLLLLFSTRGNLPTAQTAGPSGSGNRHMQPADNPQPDPSSPPVVDGKGGGTG
jgi:hypothetical protein